MESHRLVSPERWISHLTCDHFRVFTGRALDLGTIALGVKQKNKKQTKLAWEENNIQLFYLVQIKSTIKSYVETCRTYRRRHGGVEQVAGVACGHSGVVGVFLSVHHRHGQCQSSVLITHQQ